MTEGERRKFAQEAFYAGESIEAWKEKIGVHL